MEARYLFPDFHFVSTQLRELRFLNLGLKSFDWFFPLVSFEKQERARTNEGIIWRMKYSFTIIFARSQANSNAQKWLWKNEEIYINDDDMKTF